MKLTFLLSYPDSNQDKQNQNLLCYHYTIGQSLLCSLLKSGDNLCKDYLCKDRCFWRKCQINPWVFDCVAVPGPLMPGIC